MQLLQKSRVHHFYHHVSLHHKVFFMAQAFSKCTQSPQINSLKSSILYGKRKPWNLYHMNSQAFVSRCIYNISTVTQQNTCHRNFSSSRLLAGPQDIPIPSSLFFPDFPTIKVAENAIQFVHGLTGLPWWSTIILTAFLMRMLLPLPLTAYSMHNAVRLSKLEPEIKEIAVQLKKEVSMAVRQFGWDQDKAKREYIKNMKRHVKNLYIRDNCHPMKDTATFWLHIPVWLSMSYGLRNMASRGIDPSLENHAGCESLTREGTAWFADLTQTDATWILPLMLGMITLCNFELHRSRVSTVTTYQKVLRTALRSLAIVIIPISASMPSGLVLYWVSSGFFATIQSTLIVHSKWFRRLIRLPSSPNKQVTSSGKS